MKQQLFLFESQNEFQVGVTVNFSYFLVTLSYSCLFFWNCSIVRKARAASLLEHRNEVRFPGSISDFANEPLGSNGLKATVSNPTLEVNGSF